MSRNLLFCFPSLSPSPQTLPGAGAVGLLEGDGGEGGETLHTSDQWLPCPANLKTTVTNYWTNFYQLNREGEGQQSSDNLPICINIWYNCIFLCLGALFSNKLSSKKSLSRDLAVHYWLCVRHYVMASRQFRQVSGYIWSKFVPAAQFIFWPLFSRVQPIRAHPCLHLTNKKPAMFLLDHRVAEIM